MDFRGDFSPSIGASTEHWKRQKEEKEKMAMKKKDTNSQTRGLGLAQCSHSSAQTPTSWLMHGAIPTGGRARARACDRAR